MKHQIYIGYDPREDAAYEVCRHSILSRTSADINVQPLVLKNIKHIFNRPIEQKDGRMWCPISQAPMATEFAISRFAVPFLEASGWHMFMDCDIVCKTDIQELLDLCDDQYAVMVVKHKQETGGTVKADNQVQTYYARKNWSSVVLWNCDHDANKMLSLNNLNTWPGRDLHAFKWLYDHEIGELSKEWNHLVGVNESNPGAKILHYTLGGNWFDGWNNKYPEDHIWNSEYQIYKNKKYPNLQHTNTVL